ncbi:MAG: hypothetical protein ACE5OZ_25055, partial [Candidatus Heimdallarchaeota archaeon]
HIHGIPPLSQPVTISLDAKLGKQEKKNGILSVKCPNGGGKTTLCDMIEFSLTRQLQFLHPKRDEVYKSRILKPPRSRKAKRGVVEVTWDWGKDKPVSLRQEFTNKMSYPFIDGHLRKEDEFEQLIHSRLGLECSDLDILYEGLYSIGEKSTNPLLTEEKFQKDFFKTLEMLISPETTRKKIRKIEERIRKEKIREKTLMDKIERYASSTEYLNRFPREKKTIPYKQTQIAEIERDIEEQKNIVDGYEKDLQEILEKGDLIEFGHLIQEQYGFERKINDKKRQITKLEKERDSLRHFQISEYYKVRQEYTGKGSCDLCRRAAWQKWDQRLPDMCPVCGLVWELEGHSAENIGLDEQIEKRLKKEEERIDNEAFELKSEVKKLKARMLKTRKQIEEARARKEELREAREAALQMLRNSQGQLQRYIKGQSRLKNELDHIIRGIDPKGQSEIEKNQEEWTQVSKRIAELQAEKKLLGDRKDEDFENFMKSVKSTFGRKAEQYFGTGAKINILGRRLELEGNLVPVEGLSAAQQHQAELLLRLNIWENLLKINKASKAFLILDAPMIYDDMNSGTFAQILKDLDPEKFWIVVLTGSQSLINQLEGEQVELNPKRIGNLWKFLAEAAE